MSDLTPELLLCAYASGIFPMANDRDDPTVQWIDPHHRGIIPLDAHHVPRSVRKIIRQQRFEIRIDSAFEAVIAACAECRDDRPRTWLNDQLIELYCALHDRHYAHSVECWIDDRLVGGAYGLSLGGAFFGESMFSRVRDASKVALADLIGRLRLGGYRLLDTQFVTDHLKRFGAIEIPREAYLRRLRQALAVEARFYSDGGVIVSSTPWPLSVGAVGSSQSTTQTS
ncbi:MAG: leucyl/phenylalanyl-tRNA--protein transferase [Rhizobiales bacterium]|nr:leucyl/phenylalanyl-tRNA--protein transferase [Hyphomicrobiales bacterium]